MFLGRKRQYQNVTKPQDSLSKFSNIKGAKFKLTKLKECTMHFSLMFPITYLNGNTIINGGHSHRFSFKGHAAYKHIICILVELSCIIKV
jgi:hypothetical protein